MKRSLPIVALLCSAAVSFGWDLKPDPPAEKPWTPQPDMDIRVEKYSNLVGFAQQHGPFALVLRQDSTGEVYDLRTGTRTAQYKPLRAISGREVLSPGGTLTALRSDVKTVSVMDVGTNKQRPAVAVADGAVLDFIFTSDAQLVALGVNAGKRYAAVFDTATGRETVRHDLDPSPYDPSPLSRQLAVSPGEKYWAVRAGDAVQVYGTADGKKLATLELPELALGVNRQAGPVSVAFSTDGREVAAVARKAADKTGTLFVWDMTTGAKTEHPLGTAGWLEPILTGGWVVGTEVVVGGKKAPLEAKDMPPGFFRLVVSPSQVIALDNRRKETTFRTFGDQRIGTAEDGIPQGAKVIPPDATVAWDGRTFPQVQATTRDQAQVLVGDFRVPRVTRALDGRRLFAENTDALTPGVGASGVVVIDPSRNAVERTFKLPDGRFLFGDTATSDAVLTLDAPDKGQKPRLEAFAPDGKSLGGWRVPLALGPPRYAAVVSPTRAVTVGVGRVSGWQLPEGKAVWTTAFAEAEGGGLSPDGKVLFVPHAGGVRAFDTDTGGTLGNLSGGGVGPYRIAFSGDGQRLAVLSPPSRGVRVWDLATGKLTVTLTASGTDEGSAFRFFGPRFLLAGEGVYDLTEQREVWRLKASPSGGLVVSGGPDDGRVWFTVYSRASWQVAWAPFPADDLARALDNRETPGGDLFQKGERVKLVIDAPADAPTGWDAQVRAYARRAMGAAKLTEDANATTVVTVTYTTVPGGSIKMKWDGVRNLGREETIRKFSVECRAVVTRGGQVVHTAPPARRDMPIREWPLVNTIDDDSKTGQEYFTKQVWQSGPFLAGLVFAGGDSAKLLAALSNKPLGEATLGADGVNMNWPAGMEPRAVEGDPSLAPAPPPTPAPPPPVGASGGVLLVVGGLCGGVLVAAGVVVLVLVMRAKQRKKLDEDDYRPRQRKRDDEDDDRPRRRRR